MANHETNQAADDKSVPDRRPIGLRANSSILSLARRFADAGISPNTISVTSIFFAILTGGALFLTSSVEDMPWLQRLLFAFAALTIPLRLLANLLDGMVAVEFRRASATGPLFNEAPDRISDTAVLVGLGYAVGGSLELGWSAACVALFISYLRVLGVSSGSQQHFLGPMGKQHRMLVAAIACVCMAVMPPSWQAISFDQTFQIGIPSLALWVILIGSAPTLVRRWRSIVLDLRSNQ